VPLMAMIRTRASAGSTASLRLLYFVREPRAVFYRDELQALSHRDNSLSLTYAYTRTAPRRSFTGGKLLVKFENLNNEIRNPN